MVNFLPAKPISALVRVASVGVGVLRGGILPTPHTWTSVRHPTPNSPSLKYMAQLTTTSSFVDRCVGMPDMFREDFDEVKLVVVPWPKMKKSASRLHFASPTTVGLVQVRSPKRKNFCTRCGQIGEIGSRPAAVAAVVVVIVVAEECITIMEHG